MKNQNKAITACPICQHDLKITQLECGHCETKISGEFVFSKFNYINEETLYFIEIFIKNKGNIKAIEKEMNISYPTVKKLLDEAVVSLGYKVDETENLDESISDNESSSSIDILAQIELGNLNVKDALEKIKKLKVGK